MKRENINSGHMQELCTHVRLNNKKNGIEWYKGTKNSGRNQSPLLRRLIAQKRFMNLITFYPLINFLL